VSKRFLKRIFTGFDKAKTAMRDCIIEYWAVINSRIWQSMWQKRYHGAKYN